MPDSEIDVMEEIKKKMNPLADFKTREKGTFLAKAEGLTGKVVDKLISKITTNEDADTDKKNFNNKEGLTGKVVNKLISKFTTDEHADKKKKTRTQEWGYLTSELMDLLSQPNLAGFSVIGKFDKIEEELVPSEEGKKYTIKSEYNTGEKWNEKIKEQLIGFGKKYGKTDDTVDYLILCCEQYPARKNNFEFATLDSLDKAPNGEVDYKQYNKKYEPVPYHLENSRGFKFLNIHNSSGKLDTDAADSIIKLIKETISQDELLKTIIGGDSNCYYAPFGSKKGIEGIKKIQLEFKNTHKMYISKYCIAKYRPNNFLLNAQTMTKGGETTFEETMFLMVPILAKKDGEFVVDTDLYVEVVEGSTVNILEKDDYIVGFNGAIEYVYNTEADKAAADKAAADKAAAEKAAAAKQKQLTPGIEYFKTNLLSDHLPIMTTLKTEDREGNKKKTFICFSNNLSIQGSRGLKSFNPLVWKEELLHNEKEIVHYLILETVVGVLRRIKEGKYEYKDDSSFISIFYTKIYKEMYEKVATLLENIKKKTITDIPKDLTDLTKEINNLTEEMKRRNKTKNFTKIPQIDPPTPSEQQISNGGGKKKRTKKGSKKKKRTIKGSKRKRTRRNPTGRTAH